VEHDFSIKASESCLPAKRGVEIVIIQFSIKRLMSSGSNEESLHGLFGQEIQGVQISFPQSYACLAPL
jgi:hypothetical protein